VDCREAASWEQKNPDTTLREMLAVGAAREASHTSGARFVGCAFKKYYVLPHPQMPNKDNNPNYIIVLIHPLMCQI